MQSYRPVAPAVLIDDMARLFGDFACLSPFMSFSPMLTPRALIDLPGIAHLDHRHDGDGRTCTAQPCAVSIPRSAGRSACASRLEPISASSSPFLFVAIAVRGCKRCLPMTMPGSTACLGELGLLLPQCRSWRVALPPRQLDGRWLSNVGARLQSFAHQARVRGGRQHVVQLKGPADG